MTPKNPKQLSSLSYVLNSAFGFFDGASCEGKCRCGMVLKLNESHFFRLWMGSGIGSNAKAGLLGCWALLEFTRMIELNALQVFGDSKAIIQWEKGKYILKILTILLEPNN